MHIKRPWLYCYSIGSIGLYSIPNLWRLCFLQDRHISLPFSQISPSYSQVKQQQKVLILSLCIWHRQLWIFWILGVFPPPSSPVGRLCYDSLSPLFTKNFLWGSQPILLLKSLCYIFSQVCVTLSFSHVSQTLGVQIYLIFSDQGKIPVRVLGISWAWKEPKSLAPAIPPLCMSLGWLVISTCTVKVKNCLLTDMTNCRSQHSNPLLAGASVVSVLFPHTLHIGSMWSLYFQNHSGHGLRAGRVSRRVVENGMGSGAFVMHCPHTAPMEFEVLT